MLAIVDPVRFRRLSLSARFRLRSVRRRQVRLAEQLHRQRYPKTRRHLGALNYQPAGLRHWTAS
jgi:hypothetical protein